MKVQQRNISPLTSVGQPNNTNTRDNVPGAVITKYHCEVSHASSNEYDKTAPGG